MNIIKFLFDVKSMHQCLFVLYNVLYYTGCLCFKIENGMRLYYTRWSTVFGYIVRFLLVISFIGGLAMKFTDDELYDAMIGRLEPVIKFVLCFECFISTVMYIQITFSLDFTRLKHLHLSHLLQSLDDKLLKDFPFVKWNYNKTARKYNVLVSLVTIYFMSISLGFVFNLSRCRCGYISSFLLAFSYACMTCCAGTANFLYVAGMDMLRIRFRLLYKLIKVCFSTKSRTSKDDIKLFRKLKILQFYFKEYNSMIPTLNHVFSSVSGAGTFHDFAMLTNVGFLLLSKTIEGKAGPEEYAYIVLFMLPRVYKVTMTVTYGHLVHVARRNCIHDMLSVEKFFNEPKIIKQNMDSFLHWRMHNNYFFSIGNSIRCDLPVLFIVFNGIANYMIILIQLQFQQNIIAKSLQNDVELIST
ncbi:gustatory receptor 47b [Haematobia irritans]|uniref:gustatory receptor 47b n=1 Tax=Haematobia irritans TaxID=7368 RepID=UPI003F50BD4E